MPGKPENRESMHGEAKRQDKGQAGKGSIKSEEHVGSSDGAGIRFPVHDFHGMEGLKTPEK